MILPLSYNLTQVYDDPTTELQPHPDVWWPYHWTTTSQIVMTLPLSYNLTQICDDSTTDLQPHPIVMTLQLSYNLIQMCDDLITYFITLYWLFQVGISLDETVESADLVDLLQVVGSPSTAVSWDFVPHFSFLFLI